MENVKILTLDRYLNLAEKVAKCILNNYIDVSYISPIKLYGIPRGGITAALAVKTFLPYEFEIIDDPLTADIFIDDIIDSGTTKNKYLALNPNAKFYALINKEINPDDIWYVFPNEGDSTSSIEDAFLRLIQFYNIPKKNQAAFRRSVQNLVLNF